MAFFCGGLHDFLADPFFRTSAESTEEVRRLSRLMKITVVDSKVSHLSLASIKQQSSTDSPKISRSSSNMKSIFSRRAAIEEKKTGGRTCEDEEWRNSLRRSSTNTLRSSLPSIDPKSRPANFDRRNFERRPIVKPSKTPVIKQAMLPSPKEKPAPSADSLNQNTNLAAQIAQTLGCEQYLVEMIEREVLQKKPNIEWNSIAGLQEAKSLLQEAVVLPNIVPDFFKGIRRPWKGVLLVGPPGTGKTLLAKAVATECKSTFFNVTSSTLTSKYRGESEKLVRILFHMARHLAPSIIFIDEVDALVSRRDSSNDHDASRRFQAELLIQMDGLQEESNSEKTILVLAASNHPWNVDEAFRRRFEKRIYIPLPDGPAREEMLRLHLTGMTLNSNLQLQKVGKKLIGYSGADILSVCRDAAMMSLRRKIAGKSTDEIRQLTKEDLEEPITSQDFHDAIKRCKTSVSTADMSAYDNWMKEFGSS